MLSVSTRDLNGSIVPREILDATIGLRVEESEEDEGLDVSQHGESAYELE
jgi:ammonia channel protein AmtB